MESQLRREALWRLFRRAALPALAAVALCAVACGPSAGSDVPRPAGPLRIVVTVAPLAGLVKELAPSDARVATLMAPGRSEHGYEFTAKDVAELGTADLVVYVGLNLEPSVEAFLREHPSKRRVDVCWAGALGMGDGAAADEHSKDRHDEGDADDDGHHHGPVDQHLWLDPALVARMVPVVADGVRRAAENAGLRAGGGAPEALAARVEGVDAAYRERLKPLAGRAIVTHHNAWGRLADRYGLKVAAVLRPVETAEPTPGQIAKCVDAVRVSGAKTIFVEPQYNSETARRVAEAAGVKIAVLDPLGNGDWFDLMRKNLDALVGGLKE